MSEAAPAETPSQTVGPFLSIGLVHPGEHLVVPLGTPGAVRISGVLLDGAGEPVTDGLVETWQAAPPGLPGGRCPTDERGRWEIVTLPPEPLGDGQAPHLDVSVFARGLLDRVVTRIYLPDDPANATDPLLSSLPPDRAATLVAQRAGPGELRFDIRLQGEGETVFLAL